MEPASGVEGEVLRAGQLGDRCEVAGDDVSGYTSPAGGGNYGEAGRDRHEVPAGQGAKGPDRLRAPRCDLPRAPRRRETAGLVGAGGPHREVE
jgi:hypothetical protein